MTDNARDKLLGVPYIQLRRLPRKRARIESADLSLLSLAKDILHVISRIQAPNGNLGNQL